jgi:hypothetical protein
MLPAMAPVQPQQLSIRMTAIVLQHDLFSFPFDHRQLKLAASCQSRQQTTQGPSVFSFMIPTPSL